MNALLSDLNWCLYVLRTMSRVFPEKPLNTDSESAVATELRPSAVIDIGTSSIRMAIGEIRTDGSVRILESLSQAVSLGKDTFTQRRIARSTIEECVQVLTRYREVLDSYGISDDQRLRCVATSAVREAQNRLAFLDRVYIATGIQVEPLDEAEVSRLTFLGVQPTLKQDPNLVASKAVVVEVGGGSTELLVVQNGQVALSHTYNLGSLRIRRTLESLKTSVAKHRAIMENHIDRFVGRAVQHIGADSDTVGKLIALGGDFRFAASELVPDRIEDSLATIPLDDFRCFVNRMFPMSDDELVHEFHLTYPDAETLGPALLTMLQFAERMGVDQLLVSDVNLRDGLLQEMANEGVWSDDYREQVVNSAIDLGRKYGFNEPHSRHVSYLSGMLFDAMQSQHRLSGRYRTMLQLAALLHEIGLFVGISGYHKHSQYLILNSELFGLSLRDLRLVALVARYHRRASPKSTHTPYSNLSREDRVIVSKLASILRVAVALDRSDSQRIKDLSCQVDQGRFVISVPGVRDFSLEQAALIETVNLFEETYGVSVLLR